ncbi:acetyltransferase [Paraconexibacter sp. AEG42_29]|uniref:Acetyltransferase n=1 Tax=Paraconexibacter sp. AEG42_29 TaxID=2997339 RepID=A0AAU7B3J0_9ACTN
MSADGPHTWIAERHEAGTVAELLIGFRNHLGYDWPSDDAFRAGVERLIDDTATDYVLGAVAAGAPATGVVQLRFRYGIWREGFDCLVEDVYVADAARGAGLGRALMERATARALERGCRRMELDANETNAAAVALYESLGFVSQSTAYDGRDLYYRRHLPHE